MPVHESIVAERPPGRQIAFVVHPGASEGEDCQPIGAWSTGPDGESRFDLFASYDCHTDRISSWTEQLGALSTAIALHAPIDGSVAVSVAIATVGQLRSDGSTERLDGASVAIPHTVLRSEADRQRVVEQIRALELPRVRHLPPARSQCPPGYPTGECTPPSDPAWGLHVAAAHLAEVAHSRATQEVCLAFGRQDPMTMPNAQLSVGSPQAPSYVPTHPAEAFSPVNAVRTARSAPDPLDRISVVAIESQRERRTPIDLLARLRSQRDEPLPESIVVRWGAWSSARGEMISRDLTVTLQPGWDDRTIALAIVKAINDTLDVPNVFPAEASADGFIAQRYASDYGVGGPLSLELLTVEPGRLEIEAFPLAVTTAAAVSQWGPATLWGNGRVVVGTSAEDWLRGFSTCIVPDVELVALEATQVVQDFHNTVDLIRGKTTVVRAHLQVSREQRALALGAEPFYEVYAALHGYRCSSPAPDPCDRIEDLGELLAGARRSVPRELSAEHRARRDHGVDFRLPATWLDGHIEVELRSLGADVRCREHGDAVDPVAAPDCRARLTFTHHEGPALAVSPLRYRTGHAELDTLPADWEEIVARSLELLPVSSGREASVVRSAVLSPARTIAAPGLRRDWPDHRDFIYAIDDYTRLVRVLECEENDCPSGVIAAVFPEAMTHPEIAGVGQDGTLTSAPLVPVLAHELGHALGRPHVNFCMGPTTTFGCPEPYPWVAAVDPVDDRPDWVHLGLRPALGPLSHGLDHEVWGRDHVSGTVHPGSGASSSWDLMSYCDDFATWMSWFQYERLLRTIEVGPAIRGGNIPAFTRAPWRRVRWDGTDDCEEPLHYLEEEPPLPQPAARRLFAGSYDDAGGVELHPMLRRERRVTRIVARDPGGSVVVVRDASGHVLYEGGVADARSELQGAGEGPRSFAVFIPDLPDARRVELVEAGALVGAIDATPSAPTTTIAAPLGGHIVAEWLDVRLDASDADGDTLEALVEYSPDGAHWHIVGIGPASETFTIPATTLHASAAGRIRASVSDGFWSTEVISDPFVVPDHGPSLWVSEPRSGAEIGPEETVHFRAYAIDREEGPVGGPSLRWSSDRDGFLGEGAADVDASQLTPGEHVITVVASDAAGNESAATTRITVRGPRPTGADLAVRASVSEALAIGGTSAVELVVTNVGVAASGGAIELSITIPEGLSVSEIVGEDLTCALDTDDARCTSESLDLEPAWSTTVRMVVTAADLGEGTYEAIGVARLTSANDVDERNDEVEWGLVASALDVSASGLDAEGLAPGAELVGMVEVANLSTGEVAAPYVIETRLDARLEILDAAGPGWSCLHVASPLRCDQLRDALAGSASAAPIEVRARVLGGISAASDWRLEVEGPESIAPGDEGEYRIVGTNHGTGAHPGPVHVELGWPDAHLVTSVESAAFSCAARASAISCRREASVPAGVTLDPIVVRVRRDLPGELRVTTTPPPVLVPGETAEYEVRVENVGAGTFLGTATVSAAFPSNETVETTRGEGWWCTTSAHAIECTHGDTHIASGDVLPSLRVTVRAAVTPGDDSDAGVDDLLDAGVPDAGVGSDAGVDAGSPWARGVDVRVLAGDVRAVDRNPSLADPGFDISSPSSSFWYEYEYPFRPGRRINFLRFATGGVDYGDGMDTLNAPPAPANHVYRSYDVPVQGGSWQYDVYLRNTGDEPASGPIEVELALPPGMRFEPMVARTGQSSVPEGWSCTLSGARLTCTRAEGLPARQLQGVTLPVLLSVALDAERLQPIDVVVRTPGDVDVGNDVVHDRLADVRQPWGPTMRELADDHLPETALDVALALARSSVAAGDVVELAATVTNSGTEPIDARTIELELLDGRALVAIESVSGEGWDCAARWGSATCRRTADAGSFAPGVALPPVVLSGTAGPAETGAMTLTASVRSVGTRARHASRPLEVSPTPWDFTGTLAYSACPGSDDGDCRPFHDPETTRDGSRLPQVQILDLERRVREELTWQHEIPGDERAFWASELELSPAGDRLLVLSRRDAGGHFEELVWDGPRAPDGGLAPRERYRSVGDPFSSAAYAPDGETLVRTVGAGLFIGSTALLPFPNIDQEIAATGDPSLQVAQPAFAPDGRQVAFQMGRLPQLWVVDLERSESGAWTASPRRRLTDVAGRRETGAAYSPDGRFIAFSADGALVLRSTADGSERVLTNGARDGEADARPAFSPDGRWIVFERGPIEGSAELLQFRPTHHAHRRRILGPIAEPFAHAIFAVPVEGGTPRLVARGRYPAWGSARPEPIDEGTVPAPIPPALAAPAIRVEAPVGGARVTVGSSIEIVGSVAADASMEGAVHALAIVDQLGLPAAHRRGEHGLDRRFAPAVPRDWLAASEVPPECAGWNQLDLARCQGIALARGLRAVPGLALGLLTFAEDLHHRAPSTTYVPNAFVEDLAPEAGVQVAVTPGADADADGLADAEEAIASIRTGECTRSGFQSGRAPAFSGQPAEGVACRESPAGSLTTYDDVLVAMNAHFAPRFGGRRIAYLVSSGRDHVSEGAGSPLADAIRAGTVVHAFGRAPAPLALDLVVLVDERIGSARDRIADAMRTLGAHAAASELDVRVLLVAAEDWLAGTALTGHGRVQFLPRSFGDEDPIRTLWRSASEVRAWEREGAALRVLLVSDDGRTQSWLRGGEDLRATFDRPYELHVVAPEGPPARATSRVCDAQLYPHGRGNAYFDLADSSGGTKTSICDDDLRPAIVAVLDPRRVRSRGECDASSPLRRIAEATGGRCTEIDWAHVAPAWLPWADRDGRDAVDAVELELAGQRVSAAIDGSGRFRAVVPAMPAGQHELVASVRTRDGGTASHAISLRSNAPPIARPDAVTVVNGYGGVDVLTNDEDVDGDALRVVSWTQPAHGTSGCTEAGFCWYRPPTSGVVASDAFEVEIADAVGLRARAAVAVTIDTNRAPVARDFSVRVAPFGSVRLNALAHASDPDDDPLEVAMGRRTQLGEIRCVGGECAYVASASSGTEMFYYSVRDPRGLTTSALVSVVIDTNAARFASTVSSPPTLWLDETAPVEVTVRNEGSSEGSGVVLEHALPAPLELVSWAGEGWSCSVAGSVVCTNDGVAPAGATLPVLRFELGTSPGAAATSLWVPSWTNGAVSGRSLDLRAAVRDLGIEVRAESSVTVDAETDIAIDVRSVGTVERAVGQVELSLPPALELQAFPAGAWTTSSGAIAWSDTRVLAPGAWVTYVVRVVPREAGGHPLTARLAADDVPANDVATTTLDVNEPSEDPEDPDEPDDCAPGAPVCGLNEQTFVDRCDLAALAGVAHQGRCELALAIPDASATGVTTSGIDVVGGESSTEFGMEVEIAHPRRGELRVQLVAPWGATLTLANPSTSTTPNFTWRGTIRLGSPGVTGLWRLRVTDTVAGNVGEIRYFSITPR